MTGPVPGNTDAFPDHSARILLLCTANICRSVMAEAILIRRLAAAGVGACVWSAGRLSAGKAPPPEVVTVMAGFGTDVSGHRSRRLSVADLDQADLILAMDRAVLRHAIVTAQRAWPRAFTIKELIRRGELIGPRSAAEDLGTWLSRVHAGRSRSALLGSHGDDDVADPYGGSPQAYASTAALLDGLITRFVTLCFGYRHRPANW